MAADGGPGPAPTRGAQPVTALRPLRVGEVLDAAIKIYRRRPRDMVVAAALLVLPAIVLQVLVNLSAGSPDDLTRTDPATGLPQADGGSLALYLGGLLVSTTLLLVATNLALAGTTRISLAAYLGDEVDWRESLRFAFRRFWRLTALLLVTMVAITVGVLLCIAPGLWLQGIWAVAVPALLVEERGPLDALGRSRGLVRGRFWPVLGAVLLGGLLAAVLQGVLTGPVLVLQLTGVTGFFGTTLLNGVAQFVGVALTTPFTAAVAAVIYVDLRVRKEGYDLELMARGVGVDLGVGTRPVPGAPWAAGPPRPWDAPPPGPATPGPPPSWGPPGGRAPAAPPQGWGPPPGAPPSAEGPGATPPTEPPPRGG